MKLLHFIFVMLFLSVIACKKKTDKFDYTVAELQDFTLFSKSKWNLNLYSGPNSMAYGTSVDIYLKRLEGVTENIELSLPNLPDGLTAFFEETYSSLDVSTKITFVVGNLMPGTYPITLHTVSTKSKLEKDFHFNITMPDCAGTFTGSFTANRLYSDVSYLVTIIKDSTVPDSGYYRGIIIKNLFNNNIDYKAMTFLDKRYTIYGDSTGDIRGEGRLYNVDSTSDNASIKQVITVGYQAIFLQ